MWRVLSAVVCGAVVAACGTEPHDATPTPRTQTASPSAVHDPCSSVTKTVPITKVSAACATLWAPYHVTLVPPANELQLEHVPSAPHVLNRTNGAVSDADAQHWADAGNWGSGWYKWAEGNGQLPLLSFVVGPALIGGNERAAMDQGATIALPDCALYPVSAALYPIGPDGHAYFARKNLSTGDSYVFVITYPQATCSAVATFPDGHTQSIPEGSPNISTAFVPGVLRHDPMLGDIWYTDAGGNCSDPLGPPPEWCGR